MKKVIIFILVLLLAVPCFATYTDEEFEEVYNQLIISNEKLKEQEKTIESLNKQLDNMIELNGELMDQLKVTSNVLNTTDKTLDEAKSNLEESNKKIESLLRGGPVIGANAFFNFNDLPNSIYLGLNVGWRFGNNTALIGSFSTAKSGVLAGLSYNIMF